jgi:glycine/D-amino acid oxidase-like deaminating enzyme
LAKSIIVVGGGIVGCACALRLRASGFDVALIDPGDQRRGASFGNAGHIGTEQCDPWPSFRNILSAPRQLFSVGGGLGFPITEVGIWLPWSFRFIKAAMPSSNACNRQALKHLLEDPIAAWRRLFALAGTPPLVSPCGHNVVWMSEREVRRGLAAWRRADTGTATFRELSASELAHIGSALRVPPVAGVRFSGTGQMTSQPQAVRDALISAFKALGGVVVEATVATIEPKNGISVSCGGGKRAEAESVLLAGGVWSDGLMAQLGVRVPLIAERGYHVQSDRHSWPSDLPPTVFEERAVVVTHFGDVLRSTSFLEFSRPDAPADPRKWSRLRQHLDELGIEFSKKPETWMGSRPTLPDYLPAIGRLKSNPRVLYAFGHQHLGLTMAAITSEIIEAIANEAPPPIPIEALRVERFG